MEPMGFEPTTSSMPSRRAPNCATAPPEDIFNSTTRFDEEVGAKWVASARFFHLRIEGSSNAVQVSRVVLKMRMASTEGFVGGADIEEGRPWNT